MPRVEWFTITQEMRKTPLRFHSLVDSSPVHCYTSLLTIENMLKTDSRDYYIQVSNEEGRIMKRINVKVTDERFELEIVIPIVVGVVLVILIVSLVILYFLQARRLGGEMSITTDGFKEEQENTKDCETLNQCTYKQPDLVPSYHLGQ